MGEWSKKIGEEGERIVVALLDNAGWTPIDKNIDINCSIAHHERGEHGIDGVFSYISPLSDDTSKIVIISVKYTTGKYPLSATDKFKEYLRELSNAIECFDRSQQKSVIIDTHNARGKTEVVGVLVWLTEETQENDSLADIVADCRFSSTESLQDIVLLDNARASFIYRVNSVAARDLTGTIEYYYPRTGDNIDPAQQIASGKILPVEMLTSKTIVIRNINGNSKRMVIFCDEDFTDTGFARLIGLAKYLGGDWATQLHVYFQKYSQLRNGNDANRILRGFDDTAFKDSVSVNTMSDDFRS